jgi:hypothetical protein
MTLEQMYILFQDLKTVDDKIKFLQSMKKERLYYSINYDGLITAWATTPLSAMEEVNED